MSVNSKQNFQDKAQELTLRVLCAAISISVMVGVTYFFLNDGIELWKENEDFRFHTLSIISVVLGLFTMTTVFAVRGDKATHYIQNLFK